MDRVQALEVFVRVVEAGSFSAAARDLRVGQPTVSKLVAALEERLGTRLLTRTTRQLSTTDAGQALYQSARRVLADLDEAETAARGLGADLTGRVRVCTPVTFGRLHIAPHLGSFLSAHPKLKLEVVMDDRFVDLVEQNIDVAIRTGPLPDSSLTARKLGSSTRQVFASPGYLAKRGTPRTPNALAQHDAILYSPHAEGGERWRFRHLDRGTEAVVAPVSRLSFSAAEGLRAAVLGGIGVAATSRWLFGAELERGDVVQVLPRWQLSPVDLWAVFPTARLPSARSRAFVAWLESLLAKN